MEFIAIIEWLSRTGTNALIAGIIDNNSFVLIPLALILFAWLRARAAKTPATWDDELVNRLMTRSGLYSDQDVPNTVYSDQDLPNTDADTTTAGFTPDPPPRE